MCRKMKTGSPNKCFCFRPSSLLTFWTLFRESRRENLIQKIESSFWTHYTCTCVSDALSVLSVRPGIHLIPRVLLFCRESPGIMFSKLICVFLEQVVLGFSCCRPVGAASVKVLSTSVIETILFPVWDLNPFSKNQESRALENQKLKLKLKSWQLLSLHMFRNCYWTWMCAHNQTRTRIFWFQFSILFRASHIWSLPSKPCGFWGQDCY